MRILLFASEEQKQELIAQVGEMPAEVIWSETIGMWPGITGADACIDLLYDDTTGRLNELKQLKAGEIIINSVLFPLNESTSGCTRINGWSGFLKRPIVEAAGDGDRERIASLFSVFNKTTEWVPDISGFLSARIVASIINEAYFALEENVSTKDEIDTAMKLGTNYPYGPFEWSMKIGLKNVHSLLARLSGEQKRYEPAALLTKEAIR